MNTATLNRASSGNTDLPRKLRLRPLSETAVTFGNAVRAALAMDLSSLEPGTVMEVHPMTAADDVSGCAVALEGAAGQLVLENGAIFLHALTGIPLIDQADPARKTWLLSTAAALLPLPLRRLFIQVNEFANGQTPEPVRQSTPQDAAQPSSDVFLRALLVLRTADHVVTTHAWATWRVWQQVLASCQTKTRTASQTWLDVPSTVSVLVGQHVMGLDRLRTLSAGDIVIPEQPFFDVTGQGSIQLGTWHIAVQSRTGPHLEVVDVYSSSNVDPDESSAPFDQQHAPDDGDQLDALNELQIHVQFELGSLSMTLNELQSLAVGTVVSMKSSACPPNVRVLGGGRLLGKGELVDVNGQLGVQITSWTGQ